MYIALPAGNAGFLVNIAGFFANAGFEVAHISRYVL
jgi:hypothetical protein